MRIKLRGTLRAALGDSGVEVEVPAAGVPLSEVLSAIASAHPRAARYLRPPAGDALRVVVNGGVARREEDPLIHPTDDVLLMHAISGGSDGADAPALTAARRSHGNRRCLSERSLPICAEHGKASRAAPIPASAANLQSRPEATPKRAIVGVVAWKPMPSNLLLVEGWRRLGIAAQLLRPVEACRQLGRGDVALVRLDVAQALDGVEAGLAEMSALGRRGVRVLNRPAALLAAHDKRETALRLTGAGIPHPRTIHRSRLDEVRALALPFVLKPRFGSWGKDVMICRDSGELEHCLATIRDRSWFRRHGVLIQEVVPPVGYDLRVIVAGERVVGAERREAAPGEWRTNEALGARGLQAQPSEEEEAIAIAATRAIGADLLGVDLLPLPNSGYTVIEVNGAVDFDAEESLPGRSVYADAAAALGLARTNRLADESESTATRVIR